MKRNEIILANIHGVAYTYTGVNRWEALHADTFTPDPDYNVLVLGEIHGKTYAERKADAESKAIEFSHFDASGLSWGEYAMISGYFEKVGRRYGLLTDFRENAIC